MDKDSKLSVMPKEKVKDLYIGFHADKRPKGQHKRRYNVPVTSEVALLMPNNIGITALSNQLEINRRTIFDWREKYKKDIIESQKETELYPLCHQCHRTYFQEFSAGKTV